MINEKSSFRVLCNICKKNSPKNKIFCHECLSKENREKTFNARIRWLVKYGLPKQTLIKLKEELNGNISR